MSELKTLLALGDAQSDFIRVFKRAFDEIDVQYLRIRAARNVLFEYDKSGEISFKIDVEAWRCDEPVDWDAHEPLFGALHTGSKVVKEEVGNRARGDIAGSARKPLICGNGWSGQSGYYC